MFVKKLFAFLTISVLTFTLAGCGKSLSQMAAEKYVETKTGDKIDIQDNSIKIKDEQGNVFEANQDNKLPESWPDEVPYYQKGRITQSSVLDMPGGRNINLTVNSSDSREEIMNYFRDKFTAEGWEIKMDSTVGNNAVLTVQKDKLTSTVGIYEASDKNGLDIVQTLTLGE
jgi:hypothetical protein